MSRLERMAQLSCGEYAAGEKHRGRFTFREANATT